MFKLFRDTIRAYDDTYYQNIRFEMMGRVITMIMTMGVIYYFAQSDILASAPEAQAVVVGMFRGYNLIQVINLAILVLLYLVETLRSCRSLLITAMMFLCYGVVQLMYDADDVSILYTTGMSLSIAVFIAVESRGLISWFITRQSMHYPPNDKGSK